MKSAIGFRLFAGGGAAIAAAAFALLIATEAPRAQTAPAPEPGGGIVASVDGDPITEQDLDIAYDEFSDQLSRFNIVQRRAVAIDLLIHIRLIAKAATQQGIPDEPAMKERLRLTRERAIYNEYLNRLFDKEVTEDAARKLYADNNAKAGDVFEYHVRHILVPTEADAKDIINQLNAGADFAKIAADKSIDTGSATEGGDIGFIAEGDTVEPFEAAAFALKVGEYTKTPVESQFGFHIIKLDEKRPGMPKAFEEQIQDLQNSLAQNAFQKTIDDLSAKAKIDKAPAPGVVQTGPATPAAPKP